MEEIPISSVAASARTFSSTRGEVERLQEASFQVINRLQHLPPHNQVQGTALALVAMCEALNINIHELVRQARRAADHISAYDPRIKAIRDYASNELRRAR